MAGEHILVVDDEPAIQGTLCAVLEDEGYRVTTAGAGEQAVRAVTDEAPDVVFLDIWMPGMDGLETLAELKRVRPESPVIMISGHGTIETAVKATRLGAYDFIEKPLSLEKTLVSVTRALEHGRLERENANLRARLEVRTEIIGDSAPMRALHEQVIERVGGREPIKVDVRVIAASNRDLSALITHGGFREDLFYRLNVIPIEVPPLRERRDDIPVLIEHFVEKHRGRTGKRVDRVDDDVL